MKSCLLMMLCLFLFVSEIYTSEYYLNLKRGTLLAGQKHLSFRLKKGDKLKMDYSENQSTGFSWQIRALTDNSKYSIILDEYNDEPTN